MDPMTISQALRRISKIKGELKESLDRASSAVSYDIKAPPAFAYGAQLERADALRDELVKLETALRVTNSVTNVEHKKRAFTLTEATCLLREQRSRIAWLRALPCQAQAEKEQKTAEWDEMVEKRHLVTTMIKCDLPEAKRAEAVRVEQDAFDSLNDAVESANHRTMLKV